MSIGIPIRWHQKAPGFRRGRKVQNNARIAIVAIRRTYTRNGALTARHSHSTHVHVGVMQVHHDPRWILKGEQGVAGGRIQVHDKPRVRGIAGQMQTEELGPRPSRCGKSQKAGRQNHQSGYFSLHFRQFLRIPRANFNQF